MHVVKVTGENKCDIVLKGLHANVIDIVICTI